ncbi:MAG: hypothetical protein DMF58_10610 [Acidobacteria bacterium]|nr:MAG: hypothetical protein DMF58_10610 [Acidobacteriota bacterium]
MATVPWLVALLHAHRCMAEKKKENLTQKQIREKREKAGRALEEGEPVQKVTDQSGGAKRGGYFKKRDYGT